MQTNQRYTVLSLFQAALGGVVAASVVATYVLAPSRVLDSSLTVSIAGIGGLAFLYYISIHQFIKKRYAMQSALILSIITGLNIVLVTLATGGLDSPYYALWLLGMVVAGMYGRISTVVVILGTAALYGYEFWTHASTTGYITGHLDQLGISVVTAGVAEWVHHVLGRGVDQHQKATELAGQLGQEELKSNALMQSMGEGVLVVNATRQIQLFNPAAVRMTGWDEGSAQNIDYRLVLNLHDAKGNKLSDQDDPFTQVWNEGKSVVRNDLTMQTKAGRNVAVSLSLSPIFDSAKKVTGGIALFRDISSEKEIERQRNEFISTASHEMRTPVAAVEGYLSLAMNPAVATIDNRAKGYLEKAHSSTQHLGELFRDLLSITKLEDRAKIDTQSYFDLTALVKDTVSDMQFSAQKKGLELQFGTAEGAIRSQTAVMPIYVVQGNPERIREVLMNLLENAIKFTAQGVIHVTIGGNNDSVTVSVTDSGIGIAAEDIPHLFQKFYRIDNTATRTIGGTGLGLYLCRTIIELQGGRIWVESKLGEGSSFKFSLPRQASDKLAAKSPAAPTPTPLPPTAAPTPIPVPPGAQATPTMSDVRKPAGVK